MRVMVPQITTTRLLIHQLANNKENTKVSHYWPIVKTSHRLLVDSPHKWSVMRKEWRHHGSPRCQLLGRTAPSAVMVVIEGLPLWVRGRHGSPGKSNLFERHVNFAGGSYALHTWLLMSQSINRPRPIRGLIYFIIREGVHLVKYGIRHVIMVSKVSVEY